MAAILLALPGLIKAGADIYAYIAGVRAAAQQTGEWTHDHEVQFQGLLDAAKTTPQWQPDAPTPTNQP